MCFTYTPGHAISCSVIAAGSLCGVHAATVERGPNITSLSANLDILTGGSDVSARQYIWQSMQDDPHFRDGNRTLCCDQHTEIPHAQCKKVECLPHAMLNDAFRGISDSTRSRVGVQVTVNEPNHVRPENTVQTALLELGSGGKLTTLHGTQRRYVEDSYHTMSIRDYATALTPKQYDYFGRGYCQDVSALPKKA